MTLADKDNHPVSSLLSVPGIDYNIIFKIIKKIFKIIHIVHFENLHMNKKTHGDTALTLPYAVTTKITTLHSVL